MPIVLKQHKWLWWVAGYGLMYGCLYLGLKIIDYTMRIPNASAIPFAIFMSSIIIVVVVIASDKLSGIVERAFKKVITFEEKEVAQNGN
ncbi:MAG: hypothetical protein Q7S53_04910 [bacterium]|nr:hypothetical protein [bacterium]